MLRSRALWLAVPLVVDTDRSIATLIDALALEDAVISAEGKVSPRGDDELFVIKLIDAQGDRLGLRALGSMLPVDTLDETVLLVALLIFVDLSERIALLYGLGDEDIFVEAKARGKDGDTELGAKPFLARDTMDGIHLVGELAGELVDLTKFVDRQRSFIVIVDV